jgi:aldehyde dehydrogenase (NAD+)
VQYDKILGYIEQGKKEGATLHLGGNAVKDKKDGYFIEVRGLATNPCISLH